MSKDSIDAMLKNNGLTEEEIRFLGEVLRSVRSNKKSPDWSGPESSVKAALVEAVKKHGGSK